MCKTKPNIFRTTSLNRDLHHPNIPNMWRGPSMPTDLRVRLEATATFWNHEHTLTWLLPLPAFEGENTQPWTPLEEQEKKTERKVQRYQTYSQILQILTQSNMSSKEIIKFDWVDSRAYSFSTNKPFLASVRIWSSVVPSAAFDKPSLVQQSRGIQLKRALNLEHTKVSWEQTY